MTSFDDGSILTLEPLIDAIRRGVEARGWSLSGLQKTTSHQFEGRWEGESTRSAYLFFHPDDGPDFVSVDVYLDETGRGLTGNLALVVDLVQLGTMGDAERALGAFADASARELDQRHKRPITLRLRLLDAAHETVEAETEVRFKVRIPKRAIAAGGGGVAAFADETVRGFERLLGAPEISRFSPPEAPNGTPIP
ncbi:MAG: hypothetical protein OEN56_02860 [Gemmatimonadota bacterium]|nr:hypothetical protein [Gemmatimonadota bacterium]